MTNHPNRNKHQRGSRCIYGDYTAKELDAILVASRTMLMVLKNTAAGYQNVNGNVAIGCARLSEIRAAADYAEKALGLTKEI